MKESVNIAYTFAKQFVASVDKESKFFNSHQLHLHVPEGAVSKDGPSAGVAMTTSLIRFWLSFAIFYSYMRRITVCTTITTV